MQLDKVLHILALSLLSFAPYSVQAQPEKEALQEFEQAMALTPNIENGRQVFLTCAVCHQPEGWGTVDGAYPQIAGQLNTVLVKQLADIRARNRDNPIMFPFASPSMMGGVQEIADVAAYISNLPMTPNNGVGPGIDLAYGKKLYQENCVECHGEQGGGDTEEHIPAIQGQHYHYLIRQFEWIRMGKRRNADPKMVKQIQGFSPRDVSVVMDYVSRLKPPQQKLAEPGWLNPDFPQYARQPSAAFPPPMPTPPERPKPPFERPVPPMFE